MAGDQTPEVAIFWDYENVRIPADCSAARVVGDLLDLAHRHGILSTFKAYMDTSLERSVRGTTIRSHMQTSGVTVCDTPHRNQKEVADVMIITDMLMFGLKAKDPAVIILVSSDRGFVYPLTQLRFNRCKVILVSAEEAGETIRCCVDEVISFRTELLRLPPQDRQAEHHGHENPHPRRVPSGPRSRSAHASTAERYLPERYPIPERPQLGPPRASHAATSRMPPSRATASPPPYDRVYPSSGAARPPAPERPIPAILPAKPVIAVQPASGKARDAPAKYPASSPCPTEVLTISDDDDEDDEEEARRVRASLVQDRTPGPSLSPIRPHPALPSTSMRAASLVVRRSSSFVPAFPTAASSNHLRPPSNHSRSRSRSASVDTVKGEPRTARDRISISPTLQAQQDRRSSSKAAPARGQDDDDEDFDMFLSRPARTRSDVDIGRASLRPKPEKKKRNGANDTGPPEVKKRRTSGARSAGKAEKDSVLVLSDDDDG
ncbi:hypothetical protein JCM10212_003608 [Sporobolomyces blumeae]